MVWTRNDWLLAAGLWLAVSAGLWLYLRLNHRLAPQDRANHRSAHAGSVPTGAGAVFMTCALLAVAWRGFPPTLWAVAALTLTGFIDDRRPLPSALRLVVQLGALSALLWFSGVIDWGVLLAVLLLLCTVWWVNLFNFMDGANGMAGLHVLVSAVFYALWLHEANPEAAQQALLMGVAVLAFLPFNAPRARLFMGDAGSLGLSAWIAALALSGLVSGAFDWLMVLQLHLPFIIDATHTLLLRLRRRENVFEAHASHLYQQLVRAGHSHFRVSSIYALLTALTGLTAWLLQSAGGGVRLAVAAALMLALWGARAVWRPQRAAG